ncbi:hypothetical protein GYMLUDRAFT_839372 [Collybiopsis luxurians FD-317 M1]|uniref:F-box domain-containing protein n=1 Tax=Collybiopsis luxurians FD-317 M1 TaxID=944289 RepID=A0A0D0C015_9AGAR|nr:hypothetical protein GYMLUDRAFT_839372 [Collybiopsis luxurians FD-317 M1]
MRNVQNSSVQATCVFEFVQLYEDLCSNSVINRKEVEGIILQCGRDLDDYEDELTRLESRIMFIREQKERLEEYKTKLGSLTSPIRKVPNEILDAIFDYTCEWNELRYSHNAIGLIDSTHRATLDRLPSLSLSSVCSH